LLLARLLTHLLQPPKATRARFFPDWMLLRWSPWSPRSWRLNLSGGIGQTRCSPLSLHACHTVHLPHQLFNLCSHIRWTRITNFWRHWDGALSFSLQLLLASHACDLNENYPGSHACDLSESYPDGRIIQVTSCDLKGKSRQGQAGERKEIWGAGGN
jgi:hypothetical protein